MAALVAAAPGKIKRLYFTSCIRVHSARSMISSPESGSNNVYVVLENGELYPSLYSTYEAARAAVQDKHATTLAEQRLT